MAQPNIELEKDALALAEKMMSSGFTKYHLASIIIRLTEINNSFVETSHYLNRLLELNSKMFFELKDNESKIAEAQRAISRNRNTQD